ncbi:MAG: tRNA dihydrouridine(20/20a) synthase DusA [Henriciella sp.]|nr:tRNA dihydrouridine(20/20a) synthase DusA [Henriciella sp.]
MPDTSAYPTKSTYRFSVAPMMDWTDRHCRMFHRALSKDALLWTEMVTADAVIHGDRERLIGFSDAEHPVVLQLGGSDPAKLAEASRIAEEFGYDEVNINCGCPSDRVQSGRFGACLMQEPTTVAACVAAMREAVSIPVTVKCRVAVDDDPPRETLFGFVDQVADAGCEVFTVHARKAWLSGLSPKENRDIPPLDYGLVADLKAERPDLTLILNGGIKTMADAATHLATFDGMMLGRAAYQTPACLLAADRLIHQGSGDDSFDMDGAFAALDRYRPYMAARLDEGVKLSSMTRHMLGLFAGQPGARAWRRTLSEKAVKEGAGLDVLDEALSHIADAKVPA